MMALLFGPPGVGKGTQSDLLSQKYEFVKFSMGDILRQEVARQSEVGSRIKEFLDSGVLVPDKLIFELVENFIRENRNKHILFDGFPRNLNQAQRLELTLSQLKLKLEVAMEMYLSEEHIIERLTNRRYCPECGAIYNLLTAPPKQDKRCDKCQCPLMRRNDDSEEIIKKRLEVYRKETSPLVDYYKSRGIYTRIDAHGSQDEVFKKISKIIDGYITEE